VQVVGGLAATDDRFGSRMQGGTGRRISTGARQHNAALFMARTWSMIGSTEASDGTSPGGCKLLGGVALAVRQIEYRGSIAALLASFRRIDTPLMALQVTLTVEGGATVDAYQGGLLSHPALKSLAKPRVKEAKR
jgi:hypothetical protein